MKTRTATCPSTAGRASGTLTAPLYGRPVVIAEVATYAFPSLVPLALLLWFLARWEGG